MEENKQVEMGGRKVVTISKKKFILTIIILIILFIGWVILEVTRNTFISGSMDTSIVPTSFQYESNSKSINSNSISYDDSYKYNKQNPSIKDTREFMKTNYSATIKTRDAAGVTKQIKNIVKGVDGRVDSFSSSEKYGRVSFVVAKSKFDAFKEEIESITHKKLYTENISSENLLGQKQGIESQLSDTTQSLDSLVFQKTDLGISHIKAVSSINKELARIESDLSKVRVGIESTVEDQVLLAFYSQESSLVKQQTLQKQKLSEENKSFQTKNQNLDNFINNKNSDLKNINKQDTKFTDNIETVNGYINVNWVSIWEMAVVFSPIHPVWIIIILIVLATFLSRRKFPIVTFM